MVQRIRGARALRFDPAAGREALAAARLNAHPCGWRWWPRRPAALSPSAGVASPRLSPGGSAPGLGFAKNPTSPLPSAYVAVLIGCVGGGFADAATGASDATTADEAAGGLIWRQRFGRFLCSIGRSSKWKVTARCRCCSTIKWSTDTKFLASNPRPLPLVIKRSPWRGGSGEELYQRWSGRPAGDQRRGKKREREKARKERRRGRRWQSQDSGTVTEKEKERGVRMVDLSKAVAIEKEREGPGGKERLGAWGIAMRGKRRCGD